MQSLISGRPALLSVSSAHRVCGSCCICALTENTPSASMTLLTHIQSHSQQITQRFLCSHWLQRNYFCICACASINIHSRSSHTIPDTTGPGANHQGNSCHPKLFPWQPHPRGFGCLSSSLYIKKKHKEIFNWLKHTGNYLSNVTGRLSIGCFRSLPTPNTPLPYTSPSIAPSTPSPLYPQPHLCLLYASSLN